MVKTRYQDKLRLPNLKIVWHKENVIVELGCIFLDMELKVYMKMLINGKIAVRLGWVICTQNIFSTL